MCVHALQMKTLRFGSVFFFSCKGVNDENKIHECLKGELKKSDLAQCCHFLLGPQSIVHIFRLLLHHRTRLELLHLSFHLI